MTPDGVRDMAFYADNRELINDYLAGVIKGNEEVVYRDLICVVIGDFVDEDGCRYAELLAADGAGVNFTQRVEFRMG